MNSIQRGISLRHPALAGFLALFVGHGLGRFAYPALVPALVEHHWISSLQVGYIGAANLAGYLLGAVCGVRGKATMMHVAPSMLAIAISGLACAFPYGFVWLFCWRFAAGVAGGIIITTSVPLLQTRTVAGSPSGVVAIAFAGVGVGIVLTGAATPFLLRHGVGVALTAVAAVSLVMTTLSWNAWNSENFIDLPKMPQVLSHTGNRRRIILLGCSYATAAISYVPYVIFWVDYIARGLKAGIRESAICWMLFGIASRLGPFLCTQLANRIGTVRALRWTLLVNGIAVVFPLASSHPCVLEASSIGAGAMAMGASTLTAMRVREIAIPEFHQRLWAGMTIVFAVSFAAAGWAFAYMFAATQYYGTIFFCSGIALAAGVLAQCVEPATMCRAPQAEIPSEAA